MITIWPPSRTTQYSAARVKEQKANTSVHASNTRLIFMTNSSLVVQFSGFHESGYATNCGLKAKTPLNFSGSFEKSNADRNGSRLHINDDHLYQFTQIMRPSCHFLVLRRSPVAGLPANADKPNHGLPPDLIERNRRHVAEKAYFILCLSVTHCAERGQIKGKNTQFLSKRRCCHGLIRGGKAGWAH
jgi:hypothetical protein